MRSLTRTLVDRFTNRIESPGTWNHTTFNKTNPYARKSTAKSTQEMEAYAAVSTLFAVVSKISNSCGSVQWRLFRTKTDGRRVTAGPQADDNTEIISHVALDIWNKPNPFYTSAMFVESMQQHIDLAGESFIVVAGSELSPMPLELWLVRPDRIEPVPDDDEFLKGYIYAGPNGEKVPLETDQVIHVKMPNPMDPYRGLGPVQALGVDLDATKYAGMFNKNFFLNDASPGGVIEMDTRLSDSEWVEFTERWRASHAGVNNAHRVATLENGAKWKDRQFSQRDMQFAELRNLSREMIREAFALHPHMLGLTEDINRANAEAAEDVFGRWVLKPRLDRIKDALNHQLLPLFASSGTGLEFGFDDPSLEDSEATNNALLTKAQAAKVLIDAGGKFESVLEACNLPEIEFDQAKVDAEKEAQMAKAEALGQAAKQLPGAPEKNGQAPKKEPVPA